MHGSSRRALLGLSWIAACLPPEPPDWVVDYPIAWGIEIRVVEPGKYSASLDVPPGRTRADVYPYDVIEWRWQGAGPEGADLRPPIWVAMSTGLLTYDFKTLATGELPACPDPLPLRPPVCRLGAGETMRVRLGGEAGLSRDIRAEERIEVLTVASDGDVTDPETCLHLALTERSPDLSGCLFTTRTAVIGPRGGLLPFFGYPAEYLELIDELQAEAPNLNPVLTAIELTRADGETIAMQDGGAITVRRGEPLTLTLRLDAAQTYIGIIEPPEVTGLTERQKVWARFSASVDEYTGSEDGLEHRWRADGPATLYLQADDGRGGRAFATLRFVTDEAR